MGKELLRQIPGVDYLMEDKGIQEVLEDTSRERVVEAIREVIDGLRANILSDTADALIGEDRIHLDLLVARVLDTLKDNQQMSLRRVINATGTILHTNLGRALISDQIKEQVVEIAAHYSTLEYNLEAGKRGSRYSHVEDLITQLTSTEAALVVNNNAAAVMLILNTMAKDQEVVVSRGELVEIGGAFRIPEIMSQSGAVLKEVGTTNKTHLRDYENAIDEEKTGALLKVHTSNYKILGFTEEVDLKEMVDLGHEKNIPVIHDLGSGSLIDLNAYGILDEPVVAESVRANADIISFSGDKLLGGPQAGIIIGKKEWIEKMKKNPLNRVLRIDKLTLAALEATLRLYLSKEDAMEKIPTLKMMTMDKAETKRKAEILFNAVKGLENIEADLIEGESQIGGGSLPLHKLPGWMVQIKPSNMAVNDFECALRGYTMPVIARISKDALIIDVRTIAEDELEWVIGAIDAVQRNEVARG